jgi:long-chain acyl-CoA synthetase
LRPPAEQNELNATEPASILSGLHHPAALEAQTVPALLQERADANPDAAALWSLDSTAGWQPMTWREFRDQVAAVAATLQSHGLAHGDRVGILAPSCACWDIAQLAAMAAGGVVVGLDPHDSSERLTQIAAQCGLAAVIAQDEALLGRLAPQVRGRLRLAITLEPPTALGLVAFDALVEGAGRAAPGVWNEARADAPALIVFTSGTTGEPKGIEYTHGQVCGAVASILQAFPDIEAGSRLACWLPLANLFQRVINLCAIGRGAQTFYVEDPRQIMQHVGTIAPHLFIGVPRFYEKLYAGIADAIDARPPWQRRLAKWALRAGERRARAERSGTPTGMLDGLAALAADRLVLRRLRGVMGDNLRCLISGSAPMPAWLLERFHALGLLVLEAYGLSESIVPVAANRPQRCRFGTVGLPMAGVELKLAPDGELLLRGPGVFSGYLGDAEEDARVDADGFLASGDYAGIDGDGFVTLLGRKSEVFKTSTGRRIAPAVIESHLRQIAYVEHAVVFGANRPCLAAVLAVSDAALRKRLGGAAAAADVASTAAAVRADVANALGDLPAYQRPAGVVLTTRAFTVAEGHVTPNLKVRRGQVAADFGGDLDELFGAITAHTAPLAMARDGDTLLLRT